MNIKASLDLVRKFKDCTVLVVGDLMLDQYLWGSMDRISPEAPVPIMNVLRKECTLGGAGNVIKNLRCLGANVLVSGTIGDDLVGEEISQQLRNLEVSVEGIFPERSRKSTTKTRLMSVDRNQQVFRIDEESVHKNTNEIERAIFAFVEQHISSVHGILLSDYLKGTLTFRLTQKIVNIARQHEVPVVIDPKESYSQRAKYTDATAITPNIREASKLAGIEISSDDILLEAGSELLQGLRLDAVLITKGARGLSLFTEDLHVEIPTNTKQVYDVTGAGDTLAATFILGLAAGGSLEAAARLANLAAGIVVSKVGTATVSSEELFQDNPNYLKKIVSLDMLSTIGEQKDRDKTIVFINGCFDILHIGHVECLRQAKNMGDILVVGLNSDTSVRRLKGAGRPIVSESERAVLLASLEAVDYVVLFEGDTPYDLIQAIRPHILVKGKDYALGDVVGKDIVESYGGRVELVDLVEGRSTSNLVKTVVRLDNGNGE